MITIFSEWLIFSVLNFEENSRIGASLNFFVYDSIKIIFLLLIINFIMAVVRYYLPTDKIKDFLASKKLYGADYLLASIFGAITPFCTCSSIPLFVGFVGAGIPLGVTLSYLITSPLINEAAIALFVGMFGLKVTIYYVLAGILIGSVGGYILGVLKLDRYLDKSIFESNSIKNKTRKKLKTNQLLQLFYKQTIRLTKKLTPYVLLGIAVGAIIHGYVPEGYFEKYITEKNIFAVPLSVILAVPIYSNAVGVIPIIQSLVDKGIPLGTALAFMMAAVGLSLPEALILKKIMKLKLLIIFFATTAIGMMLIGYLFNLAF